MSKEWFQDMKMMHRKFGVDKWMEEQLERTKVLDDSLLREYLAFRLRMVSEELAETFSAAATNNPEEVVDGLIDLIVFSIGTLEVMGVDGEQAWDEVLSANMEKSVGIKEGRTNPFGLPDLLKPRGWVGPNHTGNHGHLTKILGGYQS